MRGHNRKVSLRVVLEAWAALPRYWGYRALLQRRRTRADVDALKLSTGEVAFFDPVAYAPLYRIETAQAMLRRLWTVTADEQWGRAAAYVDAVAQSPLRYRPLEVRDRLERLAGPLPRALRRFFERMQEEPGMIRPAAVPPTGDAAAQPAERLHSASS
jgi:hypothetical protein